MPPEHPPAYDKGCTVHLTQHCDDWSVAVSFAGRLTKFEAHHRDATDALAMAKRIAAVEGGSLVVLMTAGQSIRHEFIPPARVASYVLPIAR